MRKVDLLDAFPFEDRMAVVELTGSQLLNVLEQGLSLERGLLQVAGLQITYDPLAAKYQRLRSVHVGEAPIQPKRVYTVSTLEILAAGGDGFTPFKAGKLVALSSQQFGAALAEHVHKTPLLKQPSGQRVTPI